MHKPINNPKTASDLDADTFNALMSYIQDCYFDESNLTPMLLALALEYAYQAQSRFWRNFNLTIVDDAVSRYMPNWRTTAPMRKGGADRLFQKLERILAINSFDEANAEMLLALPVEKRPETPSSAFAWIAAELRKERRRRNSSSRNRTMSAAAKRHSALRIALSRQSWEMPSSVLELSWPRPIGTP